MRDGHRCVRNIMQDDMIAAVSIGRHLSKRTRPFFACQAKPIPLSAPVSKRMHCACALCVCKLCTHVTVATNRKCAALMRQRQAY